MTVEIRNGHAVEVAVNGLLQRARRDREAQRRVGRTAVEGRVDEAGGEAVAAADAIDEPHDVPLALMERAARGVPQHGAPSVVARRQALAQRHRDNRWTE